MSTSRKTTNIAVLAFEGISAFHLSVPCMVFQDAFVEQSPPFNLKICAEDNQALASSSGFDITVQENLAVMEQADIIVIPSWLSTLPEPSKFLVDTLQRHHQRGALIVGLCLGSYVLAYAGILNGKRATTHWAFASLFQERFPLVQLDPNPLFIEHEHVITSAGTAASLDCCLHIVRRYCGGEIANDLARMMVTAPFRSGGQQQYIPVPISAKSPKETSLSQIIQSVGENLTKSYSLDEIAERCAMSKRTFTRHFKSAYGCTFGDWLINQRLVLSQRLLETTLDPIPQVAELSGFRSESVFRKHFTSTFHVTPTQWRTSFRRQL